MALIFEGDYIVGGQPGDRVSPNFKLVELTRRNGVVRVHRELVSALQILRDRFAGSIRVTSMSPRNGLGNGIPGLFAWLSPVSDQDELRQQAAAMREQGYFARLQADADELFIGIGDPVDLPSVDRDAALETAVRLTSGFETGGDPFQQVTGNFDGAGLSFGPSQVNFGSATLGPLFNKFREMDESAYQACFANVADYATWLDVLLSSRADQLAWADGLSRGSKKHDFAQPWKGYLRAVGQVAMFRRIMTEHATQEYGHKLAVALRWLFEQVPIEIDSLRCICALYDLCTQQGSLNKAHDAIRNRLADDPPHDQFDLVHIAVRERGLTANSRWRADCVSRRLGILNRQPSFYKVGGIGANRTNRYFYLLRDVRVDDALGLRLG